MCARVWGLFVPFQCSATSCLRNACSAWPSMWWDFSMLGIGGGDVFCPVFLKPCRERHKLSASSELIPWPLKSSDFLKEKGNYHVPDSPSPLCRLWKATWPTCSDDLPSSTLIRGNVGKGGLNFKFRAVLSSTMKSRDVLLCPAQMRIAYIA